MFRKMFENKKCEIFIAILFFVSVYISWNMLMLFFKHQELERSEAQLFSLEQEARFYEFQTEENLKAWERSKKYTEDKEASKSKGLKDFEGRISK